MEGETSWITHHFDDVQEGETSWITHHFDDVRKEVRDFESYTDVIDEGSKENTVASVEFCLPDDVVEHVFALLPIATIFKVSLVCKRWNELVKEKRFLVNSSNALSHKPWYFMFTSSDEPIGYAYDPIFRKWYGIDIPYIESSNWFSASSYGLICFMDNESRSNLFVCNPLTKDFKSLEEPPGLKFSDYSALSMSVDRKSLKYTIAIVKSKQVLNDFMQWDLSIQVYDSETRIWKTCVSEVLTGWRGGDASVICDGVVYFLIYSTQGTVAGPGNRHGLVMYSLSGKYSRGLLIRTLIPVPCSLTCGRLMNLNGKLVLVGGIGKLDRVDIIKGIGIWSLKGKEWIEVSRMPHKFFQGFGELDDVFASSGSDDIIYVHSYGSPALLMFDMQQKQWKWSQKCPVTKRFPLQLFTGFCFEPRLEVLP